MAPDLERGSPDWGSFALEVLEKALSIIGVVAFVLVLVLAVVMIRALSRAEDAPTALFENARAPPDAASAISDDGNWLPSPLKAPHP